MRRKYCASIAAGLLLLILAAGCTSTPAGSNLSPKQAQETIRQTSGLVILDVRTPAEFAAGHIEGAVNIDFYKNDFQTRIKELDRATPYFIYCRSGNRSNKTYGFMERENFKTVLHLDGGINSWIRAGLPLVR